jgi:hypothetical protein
MVKRRRIGLAQTAGHTFDHLAWARGVWADGTRPSRKDDVHELLQSSFGPLSYALIGPSLQQHFPRRGPTVASACARLVRARVTCAGFEEHGTLPFNRVHYWIENIIPTHSLIPHGHPPAQSCPLKRCSVFSKGVTTSL